MWDIVIVILTVLGAATGTGYGLYRGASPKCLASLLDLSGKILANHQSYDSITSRRSAMSWPATSAMSASFQKLSLRWISQYFSGMG